jgi:hypothetical protein
MRGMEIHLSVREARRKFAEVLSEAAFGDHRIIVVRHKQEVGAFVNMDDVEFLRRYRRPGEAHPSDEAILKALQEDALDLDLREAALRPRELAAEHGGTPEQKARVALEREALSAERHWLELLMALRKRSPAAPMN